MIRVIDCGTLDWPFAEYVAMRNLTVLRIPYSHSKVVSLLEAALGLRDLELFPLGPSPDRLPGLLSAISSHIHLRIVKLSYAFTLNPVQLGWILWSFAGLESISLSVTVREQDLDTSLAEQQQLDKILATAPSCPTVKELDLESVFFNSNHIVLATFLRQCRHLESFSLPNISNASTPDYAAIFMTAKARIQHLDAHRAWRSGASLAATIQACVGLRWFRGAIVQNGPQSIVDALLEHRETLEDVDLTDTGSNELTGTMLQALLCACPRLRSFVAMMPHPIMDRHLNPVLDASDMVTTTTGEQSLDWACMDLRELAIRFMPNVDILPNRITADEAQRGRAKHIPVIPRVLVAQLGRLSKLEDLRLGYLARAKVKRSADAVNSDGHTEDRGQMVEGMQTISEAVADLATLDRLKRLELRNLKKFVDHEVLQETRRIHWRNMEWCQLS
ncbi:hypothetical protein BG006_011250 [Podila minutissima]|uniref:Uncharacterized protein n=1 Tax=Podila minutissima TaxID=64525 RepID=A0A9P5SC86_9FUNG|nr:hypothetical protein BG006_011250 [Podila minutissima]